jgi:glutathione synthase
MKKKSGSPKRPHFLWIVDPWDSLDHPNDTTLRLAQAALSLSIENSICEVSSIRFEGGRVLLDARSLRAVSPERPKSGFKLGPKKASTPAEFTQLHFRTDPPVDLAYIHPVQLLLLGLESELGPSGSARLVNPPSALLMGNEKLETSLIPELMPPTAASSDWTILAKFGRRQKKTVLKPLHQAQSKGVELLEWNSPEALAKNRALIESATEQFTRPVLLQKFLKGIENGETRLWFLDGQLLAHARKLPLQNDFRVNIDRGSRLAPHELGPKEKRAARKIGRHLKKRKIRLAAVDLIDGYVTDFNFTSPGLIVQMEKILGRNLAPTIIQTLARARA